MADASADKRPRDEEEEADAEAAKRSKLADVPDPMGGLSALQELQTQLDRVRTGPTSWDQ
jgi:hypothetical protein